MKRASSTSKLYWKKHLLRFYTSRGTSRGILTEKPTWYLYTHDASSKSFLAVSECSPIPGLSIDDLNSLESILESLCERYNASGNFPVIDSSLYPCIQFGIESHKQQISSAISQPTLSEFNSGKKGILINGLIWMDTIDSMISQIKAKLESGFHCLKLKIGALDFESEIELVRRIRARYSKDSLEIRLDANGAFTPDSALEKLSRLSEFHIHSIEQPIATQQWQEMATLCSKTPLAIALDEELIGLPANRHAELLDSVKPQYIILKPSLIGGFKASENWINLCEKSDIGWWATSALESNVGLNAIAEWVHSLISTKGINMPQGLGTGLLYSNNVPSPLEIRGEYLFSNPDKKWDYSFLSSAI
jgi:o-succinylbenzoate synthase